MKFAETKWQKVGINLLPLDVNPDNFYRAVYWGAYW